jgi:ferritin-like metal-binding protein YciE
MARGPVVLKTSFSKFRLAEKSGARQEDAGPLRDLQLIGAAQRVEHYEVAAYGTAKAMAEKLGMNEAVELLKETLEEEEEADKKLTEVAGGLYDNVPTGEEAEEESEEDETPVRAAPRRRR